MEIFEVAVVTHDEAEFPINGPEVQLRQERFFLQDRRNFMLFFILFSTGNLDIYKRKKRRHCQGDTL